MSLRAVRCDQLILIGGLLLQAVCLLHCASDPNKNKDGLESQPPIKIVHQSGDRVQLRCHNNYNNKNNNWRQGHIVWHYMSPNVTADDWELVSCTGRLGCKSILDLRTVTMKESGFYRCSQRNKSLELKPLNTFQLEILEGPGLVANYPLDADNAPDLLGPSPEKPVRVFRPAGREVELECRQHKLPTSKMNTIRWFYKKCATKREVSPCSKFEDDSDYSDWLMLTCGGECCNNMTLELKPTEEDNGLYRCSIKNGIVITYELEVVDKVTSGTEIVEVFPHNTSVILGSTAPFQCRVYSKVKPLITWFRKRNSTSYGATQYVTYLNDTYEQMMSHQVEFHDHLYLSKMVIGDARLSDTGVYVCVAVNTFDANHMEAYLTVLPKYFRDDVVVLSDTSLHWLFLIPAALALIPVSAWFFCWYKRKQADLNASQSNVNNNLQLQQGFKYKPVTKTKE